MTPKVISFHYVLKNGQGRLLEKSNGGEPFSFLSGQQQILPRLEEVLLEMTEGESQVVKLSVEEAYGPRRNDMVVQTARKNLPKDLQVGQQFMTEEEDLPMVTVIEFDNETVTLDGNHPLAGQDLTFEVELVGVRDATAEEVAHGHAHGPGGHIH